MTSAAPVPFRRRLTLSVTLGLLAGTVTYFRAVYGTIPRDFGQVWFAARSVLHGENPYMLVGPGRAFEWACALFYPLPAVIAAIPFAPLPPIGADVLFMVIGGAALAWALMQHGYDPLLGFFSASAYFAFEVAQWSPLLAGAVVLAPLSLVLVAKPTIGAAIFAARPSWWAIGGGLTLAAIAFAVQPGWLMAWLTTLREPCAPVTPYRAPVTVPGGALALLCLLRWRRPEARLVAALACVPQTLLLYETVPLLLVPRTIRETAILTVLGYAGAYWMLFQPIRSAAHRLELSGQMIVLLLYLPCTVMVLRRPNVAHG